MKTASSSRLVFYTSWQPSTQTAASESQPELEADPVMRPPLPAKMLRQRYARKARKQDRDDLAISKFMVAQARMPKPTTSYTMSTRKYLHSPHSFSLAWAYLPRSNRSLHCSCTYWKHLTQATTPSLNPPVCHDTQEFKSEPTKTRFMQPHSNRLWVACGNTPSCRNALRRVICMPPLPAIILLHKLQIATYALTFLKHRCT